MKKFKSYKEESRTNWGMTVEESVQPNLDQINTGAMLRIADATEAMAKNFIQLQNELKWAKERNERLDVRAEKLRRQVSAYKGIIKKLKSKP